MTSSQRTVGFIGLGNMGLPMAAQVASTHDLVVYTRREHQGQDLCKSGPLHRAKCVETIQQLVQACEILIVCLPNDETSIQVLLEDALPHARPGQVFVDTSTVEQATNIRCAKACSDRAVEFLDAPISGGPTKATNGTLTIMCGGPQKVFDDVLPVLECMGTHVRHMGPHGAGTATKLVNQLLVGVHSVAACEAMLLAEKLGVTDQQALHEVLQTATGCSEVLKRHMPVIAASEFKATSMPLRNMVKDLKIVHQAARQADLTLPVTAVAEKVHTDTAREGYEDWDMAVPYVVLGRTERDMCGPRLGISDEQWGF